MHAIKVVSDLICPWCYIGKRRLEAALQRFSSSRNPVSVSWRPFQLNPDMPPRGMDRTTYRMRKFGDWEHCQQLDAQLTEVGREHGIRMRLDLQLNTPNTFDSHRVIWLAEELGVQDSVVEALFRAYFCEGTDLSDRQNLIEVAAGAGMDKQRLERMLDSREGTAEVQAEEQAIKILGLTSVPLFIFDDCVAVAGAQPADELLKALKQAQDLLKKQRQAQARMHPSCSTANS